jgi:hypothetical protein
MCQWLLPMVVAYDCLPVVLPMVVTNDYLWLLPIVVTYMYGCYLWFLYMVFTYGC